MSAIDPVQQLYERFPYPRPAVDLAAVLGGQLQPAWNPRGSFPIYFPDRAPNDELDVLIAGCGTSTGPQHAALLPRMRFVAIDVAEAPLQHSRRLAERHGLTNIEFVQLPIERVAELGRRFDFVSCHGVLHHMADPVAGLRALASVTKPDGALSLMVYGKYGRTGIAMLQELFRDRLALSPREEDVMRVQAALQALPDGHPFRIIHKDPSQAISLEEIADMMLHPRDRAYTVEEVRALVEGAGLQFQRWLGQAQYAPEVSPLAGPAFAAMDGWQRAAAMELFHGTIIKHEFVVTHPGRPRPDDLFAGDRMEAAIPRISAHLVLKREGETFVLTNNQHQIQHQLVLSIGGELALLRGIDGARSVAQITASVREAGFWGDGSAAEVFRLLYLADAIDLSAPRP